MAGREATTCTSPPASSASMELAARDRILEGQRTGPSCTAAETEAARLKPRPLKPKVAWTLDSDGWSPFDLGAGRLSSRVPQGREWGCLAHGAQPPLPAPS